MSAVPPFKEPLGGRQKPHTDDRRRIAKVGSGTVTWGPRTIIKVMSPGSKQHTELNLTVQRPQGQSKGVRKTLQVDPYVGDMNWDIEPGCFR